MPGGWQGSDRRSTLPKDWPVRVNAVHERSGGRCEVTKVSTGKRCPNLADGGVDHIVRPADGGTDDLSNLRDTCHYHHSRKTAAEANAAKAAKAALRRRPDEDHPGLRRRR